MIKKLVSIFVTLAFALSSGVTALGLDKEAHQTIDSLFEKENEKVVFGEDFLSGAGTTASDWYVLALKTNDVDGEYDKYLDAVSVYVNEKYQTENKLHRTKATEWHRIALVVEACGGNAEDFIGINLIADGIYNFDFDKQGINAYLWGLITLSADDYALPQNPLNTKETIIKKICEYQLSDGGFALSGEKGDVDVTSVAIIALSSYKSEKNVADTIDKAVEFLKKNQLSDGGFESLGVKNCESSCQALMAFDAVGEDYESILSDILTYKTDNGFSHLKDGEMNYLATQQALLAFGAVEKSDYLYDFSNNSEDIVADLEEKTDISQADRDVIKGFSEKVNASDIHTIKRLLQTVESVNPDDKFVLKTVLEMALSDAEKIQKKIDYINKNTTMISKNGVKISHKKTINKLIADYEKLSDSDKKLVSDYDELLKLKAEADTLLRKYIISAVVIVVIILCVIYLLVRRKMRKTEE